MTVTEAQRLHLFKTFEGLFPDEDVATLMTLLPPSGWEELATKSDLRTLAAELRTELHDELRHQTTRFVGWMLGGMGTLTAVFGTVVALTH